MGPASTIRLLAQTEKKAPGGVNPLLQGLGGYTRRVRSRAPTGTTKYKTQSQTGAVASQVSTKPQESALTPPEARGLLSDTARRGTLSKNQKYCLNLAKIKAERLPQGLSRFSDSPEALRRSLMRKAKSAPPRPSRRGPAPKGLGRDAYSPIRLRPGSANKLVTSVPT